jgi:XTP/dITP diphosphohydrolase
LRELRALVSGLVVLSPDDIAIPPVDEDGATFEANAIKKAKSACAASGMAALADDSGLEVDVLGGAPGVHSARYAGGDGHDDAANNRKLLAELGGVPDDLRTARFRCVLALVTPDGNVVTTAGSVEGRIAHIPRGDNGFGYDPLFLVAEIPGKTMAELDSDEKNRISHRARAMHAMRAALTPTTAR